MVHMPQVVAYMSCRMMTHANGVFKVEDGWVHAGISTLVYPNREDAGPILDCPVGGYEDYDGLVSPNEAETAEKWIEDVLRVWGPHECIGEGVYQGLEFYTNEEQTTAYTYALHFFVKDGSREIPFQPI